MSKIVEEIGRRMCIVNILKDRFQVYYASHDELREYLASSYVDDTIDFKSNPEAITCLQQNIYHNQTMRTMLEHFKRPSSIIPFPETHETTTRSSFNSIETGTLTGVGCAKGVATGPARVILSLESASLVQPGDILITKMTSPGWTPLFSIIAGLITEDGGILSHAAVVARECGIPAVLQIENATKLFISGSIITVNGTNGTVTLS